MKWVIPLLKIYIYNIYIPIQFMTELAHLERLWWYQHTIYYFTNNKKKKYEH